MSAVALPRLAIIVLHYRGLADTLACLESLRTARGASLEMIVVDNASPDGPPDTIRDAYPEVELISTGANLGYAGGNNAGIRAALARGVDAVFLVNNDTLLDAECPARLAQTLVENPRIGIIGPMVYTFDDGCSISSAGGAIDWRHADAANLGAGEIDRGQYAARCVDFVNGCGLMITRAALERIGLIDERFFMYWEETDWCTRARRAGFEVRFEPAVYMRHKAPIVWDNLGPATLYYTTRNRLLFFARHAPWRLKPLALAHAVNGARREATRHEQAGRMAQANAMRAGMRDAFRRRWGRVDLPAQKS